jgi:hypothetical protein
MTLPLILYRISGWITNLPIFYVGYLALQSKQIWKGRYKYLASNFILAAILSFVSSLQAIFLINNLWADYLYVPLAFIFKALYLKGEHKNRQIKWLIDLSILLFLVFQIIKYFKLDHLNEFNSLGYYGGSPYFVILSLYNLRLLFRQKKPQNNLRLNPDFWFTATIFCRSFLDIIFTIFDDITYAASPSDNVFYALFIFENLIRTILYFGYYKGLKLLS